jgi:hypothetical protein
MSDPDRQAKVEKLLLIICPLGLVLSLLTSHRGGESESGLVAFLSVGLPIVIVFCVIILGLRVLARIPTGAPGRGLPIFFMVLGIAAGLILLGLRFTNGSNDLPPADQMAVSVKEIKLATMEWSDAKQTLDRTRWQQAALGKEELRDLSLEDLRVHRTAQDTFHFCLKHAEIVLTKLEKNGMLASVTRELVSRGYDRDAFNPRLMHLLVRMAAAGHELTGLMEANFEDWRANGIPDREHAMKPWQKKARALSDEILSLEAEAAAVKGGPEPSQS